MTNAFKRMVRTGPAVLAAAAGVAHAQVNPAIQINFNGTAPVPMSPVAIALIAIAVAAIAAVTLRRSRRGRTIAGLAVAAVLSTFAPGTGRFVQEAFAGIAAIPLVTSPTVYTISGPGTYPFQNALQTPISLTVVTLNNPGGLQINTSASTCAPTVVLAPNASCTVVVVNNNT